MGPRARRRLIAAGVVVVLAAAGAAGYLLTRSGSSRPSTKEVFGTFGGFGVASGATAKQVTARLGPPDEKRGGCWIYRIRGTTFHGTTIIPQIAGMDAVRYCFYGGVVSVVEDHWRKVNGGDPFQQPWIAPLEFGCGGKRCVVTS